MNISDYEKVAEKLNARSVKSCLNNKSTAKSYLEIAKNLKPLTSRVCRGCGKDMKTGIFSFLPTYCDECMECRNNEEDYTEIRKIVWAEMKNFVHLNDDYTVRIRWMRARYGISAPISVRGGHFRKAYLSARCPIRRDALEIHMVNAYMDLWRHESGDKGWNDSLCLQYLDQKLYGLKLGMKDKIQVLNTWYILLYLYRKDQYDRAERYRRIVMRDEKVKNGLARLIEGEGCYPYPLNGTVDKEYLNHVFAKHPIAEMERLC